MDAVKNPFYHQDTLRILIKEWLPTSVEADDARRAVGFMKTPMSAEASHDSGPGGVHCLSEERLPLVELSFRSMLLIDVFLTAVSLLIGFLLVNVLALSNLFLQFYIISGVFSLHALFSITLYIHKEVDESIRFLNTLMLISLTSSVVNLIVMYFRMLLS